MTRSDIIHIMGTVSIEAQKHPAFEKFVILMNDKLYGYDPLISAWYYFKKGWDETNYL